MNDNLSLKRNSYVLRIAIVGLEFGTKVLLPAFRKIAGCEVVALCGTNIEKTKALSRDLDVLHAFDNVDQMLKTLRLDAVVISAPPGPQVEIAEFALKHDVCVFAEKPLGITPVQTSRLCELARGMTTMVDFEFPEIPVWHKAKQCLGSAPSDVEVQWKVMTYTAKHFVENWKYDPHRGGGALHIFGSHMFYNLEWFMGPIRSLKAQLSKHPSDPRDTHTEFSLVIAFRSGRSAHVLVDTRFEGESVHIWRWNRVSIENRGSDYIKDWKLFQDGRYTLETPAQSVDGRIMAVSSMAARFVDAGRRNDVVTPNFEAGHRVQQLIERAFDSAKNGVTVDCS